MKKGLGRTMYSPRLHKEVHARAVLHEVIKYRTSLEVAIVWPSALQKL